MANEKIPDGFKLVTTLRGHGDDITEVAWSPDGRMLASASSDLTMRLWSPETGQQLRVMRAASEVNSVAWSPDGRVIATGGKDGKIRLWDVEGTLLRELVGHTTVVFRVAYSPDGKTLASSAADSTIRLWNTRTYESQRTIRVSSGFAQSIVWARDGRSLAYSSTDGAIRIWSADSEQTVKTLRDGTDSCYSISWSPDGRDIAAAMENRTIRIWNPDTSRQKTVLQGDTEAVTFVTYSSDGNFLASKSFDGTTRVWRTDTWEPAGILEEADNNIYATVAFHPTMLLLVTQSMDSKVLRIWRLDREALMASTADAATLHYTNAKAVLVGDTGVGKSGLGLVLTSQQFAATESTHGRYVWTFDSREVERENGVMEKRETLLWDMAGQPGYRLIHQLHLNDVSVALVVFDSRSESDPFAGVRHWSRALRQAERVQGDAGVPMKKYLVAARLDRGSIGVSAERREAIVKELDFDGYFETSSKEGWGIQELAQAIRDSVDWDALPRVSSTELFQRIKDFLMAKKQAGRLLATEDDLFFSFLQSGNAPTEADDLVEQFETCIGLVESRDLIRRLSFGNFVLLQPELIDSYASALVNYVKDQPDGLGSILQEDAALGRFPMPKDERLRDKEQEKLLLVAMVEDLLRREIALREQSADGSLLVFPAQSTRERSDLPDPPGKAVTFTFEGATLNIYSSLSVRMSHSGLFERLEIWKNAATFSAIVGGECGMFMRDIEEGKAEITLFFDDQCSEETKFQFEQYIQAHLHRRALSETIQRRRVFVCSECGTPLTEVQVTRRRERGFSSIECSVCGEDISLLDTQERLVAARSASVIEMDRRADFQRELDAGLVSAAGEMRTQSFRTWAGSAKTTLAVVFTDVVGSTKLGVELGNEAMNEVRRAHFKQGRHFIDEHGGYSIKTIGDSLMAAFRTVSEALEFALAFYSDTGHPRIRIRAGIHVGPVYIEEEDAFGSMVNYASRVISVAQGPEIRISSAAKSHVEQEDFFQRPELHWERHTDQELKGFEGVHTLWSVVKPEIVESAAP